MKTQTPTKKRSDQTTRLPQIVEEDKSGFYRNQDGIYPQVPEAHYHGDGEAEGASRRASNSVLSVLFDKTPSHALAKMNQEHDPSRSQKFGRAFHTAALTPQVFDRTYQIKGTCRGVTNSGDGCSRSGSNPWRVQTEDGEEEVRWYCGTHEPEEGEKTDRQNGITKALSPASVETVSKEDMKKIEQMQESLVGHDKIRDLLHGCPSRSELTVLWTHRKTGVRCKSRIDRLVRHPRLGYVAVDLKTTQCAKPGRRPGAFGYDAAQYGYDRQAAFYMEALASHEVPVEYFVVIAIEKTPPYGVVPFVVRDEHLEKGRREFEEALQKFRECKKKGEWPGYTDQFIPLEQPEWR